MILLRNHASCLLVGLFCVVGGFALGTPWASAQGADSGDYRIGPRDVLSIRVAELEEVSQTVEVAEDGTIELPILGVVAAQGLTAEQLAAEMQAELQAKGVRRATVTVRVREFRISVLGAVGTPGLVTVPTGMTLLEVLVSAGGLADDAAGVVYVRRRGRLGLTDQVGISTEDLLVRGDPSVNLPIMAGDLIQVPPAELVTVHVLGQVERAGVLTFEPNESPTLLAALAKAGGFTETAARTVRIQRQGPDGVFELEVNSRRIVNGKEPNLELFDGDIIIVKESFF